MNGSMKSGYIDLGTMGKGISKKVPRARSPWTVYDARPEPTGRLVNASVRLLRLVVCMFFMVSGAGMLYAQDYPIKPIRIFTSAIGGGNDLVARILAQGLTASIGQPVVVDNRGDAVLGELVAQASPDGYTLLIGGGSFTIGPLLQKKPYDVFRDFLPISLVATQSNILVVHPSLPVKSVTDLIALAKAKPGELRYASSGIGSSTHLTGELFKQMAGINMTRINYKDTGPALSDLIGGEVQLMFPAIISVTAQIKAGKLKALAVTSAQPTALYPGLPAVATSGLPGYESIVVTGFYAPAKTPDAIITRLSQQTARFLNGAAVKEKLLNVGAEAVGSSPEVLATTIKSQVVRMGKVINDAGIRVE